MSESLSSSSSSSTLIPNIKPINPAGLVSNLMSRLYGMELIKWKELVSYDDRNFLVSVRQDEKIISNFGQKDPNRYLLKIFNLRDSQNLDYIDAMYTLTDFIANKGVPTPQRIPNIDGNLISLQKIYTDLDDPSCAEFFEYIVVLQTFLPGITIDCIPLTPSKFYECGKFAGFIDKSLQGFHHSYYDNHETIWSLESVPKLLDYSFVIEDPEKQKIVHEVIETYIQQILPLFPKFHKGQIHGDMNLFNLLAKEKSESPISDSNDILTSSTTSTNNSNNHNMNIGKEYVLSGIIDFADSTNSYPVFDLALVTCYLMIECKLSDPLEVGGHTLAGYLTEFDLNQIEIEALPLLVCGRLVQSLVLGMYTYWKDPTNDYTMDSQKRGWPLLMQLWRHPMKELYLLWEKIVDSYT